MRERTLSCNGLSTRSRGNCWSGNNPAVKNRARALSNGCQLAAWCACTSRALIPTLESRIQLKCCGQNLCRHHEAGSKSNTEGLKTMYSAKRNILSRLLGLDRGAMHRRINGPSDLHVLAIFFTVSGWSGEETDRII